MANFLLYGVYSMISIVDISIGILFLLNIVFLFIGYFLGKSSSTNLQDINSNIGFFKQNSSNTLKNVIEIDDKKIVTKINTDNLEKKYDSLGEINNSSENISSSINKLKNMKG